jgi:hypothetical protein
VGLGFVMGISVVFFLFLLHGGISHYWTMVGYIRGRCFVILLVFSSFFFLYAISVLFHEYYFCSTLRHRAHLGSRIRIEPPHSL